MYFRTTSVEESIGLYMWNIVLSACFNALLSNFEIVLRNNIHRAMSVQYCSGVASGHWYDLSIKAQLKPETLNKIDDVRYTGRGRKRVLRTPTPNPDEIVSRVSFGFWPSVLKAIPQPHAHAVFPSIFPSHVLSTTPADWGDAAKRDLRAGKLVYGSLALDAYARGVIRPLREKSHRTVGNSEQCTPIPAEILVPVCAFCDRSTNGFEIHENEDFIRCSLT